jgi:ubiquinone/menaquinone biosynthesis C-methylase UbiE
MATQSFDPERYKQSQHQEWDAVANGWRRWWQTFEQGAQHLSNRMVEMAEIQTGHRVLDVATGIGEPAITAAQKVAPNGQVTATDLSPEMLDIAKERAVALGLQNIEFRQTDAEALDLAAGSFDAALCRWGLMYLPNLRNALSTVRKLLDPAGRFTAAVWSVPAKVPFNSLPMAVLRERFDVPAPPAGTPSPFGLADPSLLEKALTQVGFTQVNVEPITVTFEFESVDSYTGYLQDISPSIRRVLGTQPKERQAEAWNAIAEVARERYADASGRVSIPNETICVIGR